MGSNLPERLPRFKTTSLAMTNQYFSTEISKKTMGINAPLKFAKNIIFTDRTIAVAAQASRTIVKLFPPAVGLLYCWEAIAIFHPAGDQP